MTTLTIIALTVALVAYLGRGWYLEGCADLDAQLRADEWERHLATLPRDPDTTVRPEHDAVLRAALRGEVR